MQPVYRCRVCKELWETEIAAETCCEHVDEIYQCPDCDKECLSQQSAEECCK